MKKLWGLTKGIVSDLVAIVVFMVLLLVLWILLGEQSDYDVWFIKVFIYFILLALFVAGGAIYLAIVVTTYNKAKKKLMAIQGFSEERFERETDKSPQFRNVLCCCDAICYAGTAHMIKVIPITDIVWAYQAQTGYVLQLYTRDREKHTINVYLNKKFAKRNHLKIGAEEGCRYLLRLITRKNKNAMIGYEASYEEMYKKDFERLLMQAYGKVIVDSGLLEQEYIENDYYHKDFH